jgi:hypothetical protein
MKRVLARATCIALFLAVTGCAASYGQGGYGQPRSQDYGRSPRPSSAGADVDVSVFYDALSPYGQWFEYPSYGWCWTPYDVSEDWRPYSDGHWENTDYGWSWAANEEWAGAVSLRALVLRRLVRLGLGARTE